jgi:hypothetical protein
VNNNDVTSIGLFSNVKESAGPLLVIMLVTVAVFLPALGLNFNPATDDYYFILLNPAIKDISWHGFLTLFNSMSTRYNEYQPVVFVTFWLNYAVSGLAPLTYYLVQVLLHACTAALVYLVLQTLVGSRMVSFLTALIFSIHPLQIDTVAMLNQRENIISTAFALLSILSYITFKERRETWHYACAFVFYCLSLLSDSPWVILPFLLLLVDNYQGDKLSVKLIVNKVPFFLVSLTFVVLTLRGQQAAGMSTPYHFGSFTSQISLVILIYIDFIASFFAPVALSTGYTYSPVELSSSRMLIAAVSMSLLALLTVVAWRRSWRILVFGLLWFSLCIAPFSQIIPYQIVRADHYMYHPLIGLAIIVAAWLDRAAATLQIKRALVPVTAALALILVPVTIYHLGNYASPHAYIDRFAQTQGWAPSVEVIRARVFEFQGNTQSAKKAFLRALDNYDEPHKSYVRLQLSRICLGEGRRDEAKSYIEQIPPGSPYARVARKIMDTLAAGGDNKAMQAK